MLGCHIFRLGALAGMILLIVEEEITVATPCQPIPMRNRNAPPVKRVQLIFKLLEIPGRFVSRNFISLKI